jgi:Arc/MetJ-type ribon-helix-helix transcriptional regulator
MSAEIHRLKERTAESEKVTVNLGYVDLGHIDLLVQDGFYANRSDFIRTAIRNQLGSHADHAKKQIVRQTLDLGLRHFSRSDLESAFSAGEMLDIKVLGLVTLANDITAELAVQTIRSITVLGALHADAHIKAALSGRIF